MKSENDSKLCEEKKKKKKKTHYIAAKYAQGPENRQ